MVSNSSHSLSLQLCSTKTPHKSWQQANASSTKTTQNDNSSLWRHCKVVGTLKTECLVWRVSVTPNSNSVREAQQFESDKITDFHRFLVNNCLPGCYFVKGMYIAQNLHTVLSCPNKTCSCFNLLRVLICFLNTGSHLSWSLLCFMYLFHVLTHSTDNSLNIFSHWCEQIVWPDC